MSNVSILPETHARVKRSSVTMSSRVFESAIRAETTSERLDPRRTQRYGFTF
ncbi:hypothetical protein HSBGL_2945 [Halapricum desulfuricans]|uniref:Uncharacterized protein n=1 Tax=Halapricum desulfuricans TaxID=2841257 RepID=A0A897NR74_9EURY|nr:hypothetical protein HSBGL_2945 [Halapricum desulfuricans]